MSKYLIALLFISTFIFNDAVAQEKWKSIFTVPYSFYDKIYPVKSVDSLDCIALMSHLALPILKRTTDGGKTWKTAYEEYQSDTATDFTIFGIAYLQYPAKNWVYWSYNYGYIKRTSDGFKTIDTMPVLTNSPFWDFRMLDSLNGIGTGGNIIDTLFVTKDGWKTYESITFADTVSFTMNYMISADTLFLFSSRGDIGAYSYKTCDAGKTWKKFYIVDKPYISDVYFVNSNLGWMTCMIKNGVGDQDFDVIYKTTNGGDTWELNYKKENEYKFGLRQIAFVDEYNGLATGAAGKILRTKDGGKTWVQEYTEVDLPNSFWGGVCKLDNDFIVYSMDDIWQYPKKNNVELSKSTTPDVYPNPFVHNFTIDVTKDFAYMPATLKIYNSLGSQIYIYSDYISCDGKFSAQPGIDPDAVYYYSLCVGSKEFKGKIIKR